MIVFGGLSPAWQQILLFDRLVTGEVNRAGESRSVASGKVINAARAARGLGSSVLVVTVAGGSGGDAIRRSLEAESIPHRIVDTGSSRTCTTVIERSTRTITELVENAPSIGDRELDEYVATFREAARDAEAIVLLGSLPSGARRSCFREMVEGIDAPVIADVRGPELLELLATRPLVVKPNHAELAATLDVRIDSDDDLDAAMARLHEAGAGWVLITRGETTAIATHVDGERHRFTPPSIEVLNPIGSGDSLSAGIAVGIVEGQSVPAAIRLGMACAVENALSLVPGEVDGEAVRARLAAITCSADPAA